MNGCIRLPDPSRSRRYRIVTSFYSVCYIRLYTSYYVGRYVPRLISATSTALYRHHQVSNIEAYKPLRIMAQLIATCNFQNSITYMLDRIQLEYSVDEVYRLIVLYTILNPI